MVDIIIRSIIIELVMVVLLLEHVENIRYVIVNTGRARGD